MFYPPLFLFQFFLGTETRTFFPEDYSMHVTTLLKNPQLPPDGHCTLVGPFSRFGRPRFYTDLPLLSMLLAPARSVSSLRWALVRKSHGEVLSRSSPVWLWMPSPGGLGQVLGGRLFLWTPGLTGHEPARPRLPPQNF